MSRKNILFGSLLFLAGLAHVLLTQVWTLNFTGGNRELYYNALIHFCLSLFLFYQGLKYLLHSQRRRAPKTARPWLYLYDLGLLCFAGWFASTWVLAPVFRMLTARGLLPVLLEGTGGIGYLFLFFGALFLFYAYRSTLPSAAQLIRERRQRPIVFLRAFKDDRLAFAREKRFKGDALWRWLLPSGISLDRAMSKAFQPYGPFVALGHPGESIPREGAARDRVLTDWQQHLASYLHNASLLVVLVGESSNLAWEIGWILRHNRITDTLLVLPPASRKEIRKRWDIFLAQSNLQQAVELPDMEVIAEAMAIYFTGTDQPRGIVVQGDKRNTQGYINTLRHILDERLKIDFVPEQTPAYLEEDLTDETSEDDTPNKPASPGHKLFSVTQIVLASLITPLAGLVMLAHNNWQTGLKNSRLWAGLAAVLFLLLSGFVLLSGRDHLTLLVNVLFTFGLWLFARWKYELIFKEQRQKGGKFQSYGLALLVTLVATAIYLLLFAAAGWVFG